MRTGSVGQLVVTEMWHYIVDLDLQVIDQPYELSRYLDGRIGVVEHGLFLDIADEVIVGSQQGVSYLRRTDLQKKM